LWLLSLLSGASRQVANACACIALIAATNICATSNSLCHKSLGYRAELIVGPVVIGYRQCIVATIETK